MKKLVIVSMMILAATAVFASGQQELNDEGVVVLNRAELAQSSYLSDLDKIELTGTVLFESPVPELKVGSKQYSLMAPGSMAFSGYITEGDKISVTGYVVDEDSAFCQMGSRGQMGRGFGFQNNDALDGNTVIMVETVEIDGTVYELPWVENGMGGRGGWQDQQSGSGRSGMRGDQGRQSGGMRSSF